MGIEGNKFERILKILITLSEYKWIYSRDIADMLGVSKRTVLRYIKDIRMAFAEYHIEIIESNEKDGYKLKQDNFQDKIKGIDDLQTIAAIETSSFTHPLSDKKLIRKEIIEKIAPRLSQSNYIDDQTLKPLLRALYDNRILEIEYEKKEGEKKTYKVLPLKLITNEGTHYLNLYCFNPGYDKLLSFVVSKIVKISPKEICRDKELITEKISYINSRWGIFVNDTDGYEDNVKFEVNDSMYQKLLKYPLHPTQEYIGTSETHIFTLKVHNLQEFARWTLKYSYHIKVLESDYVISALKKEAYRILDLYES